jgi:hypothetical protein
MTARSATFVDDRDEDAPVEVAHGEYEGLRRFALSTRDARTLYERFGFETVANPDRQMEILRRDIYRQQRTQ